jgi:hypothetical protein
MENAPFSEYSLREVLLPWLEEPMLHTSHPENSTRLHFSAPFVQGRVLAGLPWRRNQLELLQHPQAVKVAFDPLHQALPSCNAFTS